MPCYRAHGLTIRLPIPVDGLFAVPDEGEPDLDVGWAEGAEPDVGDSSWTPIPLVQNAQGYPLYRAWRREGDGYLWHSAGPERTIRYRLRADLRGVEVWRDPEISPLRLVRPALGPALAFLLRARGRLLLHAASVVVDGRALLIVGASGQGKSTLVYSLTQQGCGVLTDDMTLVDLSASRPAVHASQHKVRLTCDSIARLRPRGDEEWPIAPGGLKREVRVPVVDARRSHPIAAIVLLEPRGGAGAVNVEPVPAGEAVVGLTREVHPRYLPVGGLDPEEVPLLFRELSRLVAGVRVLRLLRPDGVDSLPEAGRQVRAAAGC